MEWLTGIIQSLGSIVGSAVSDFFVWVTDGVSNVLPLSPTVDAAWLEVLRSYAGYVNYFIPVGAILTFLSAVLVCVGVYYVAMIVLRWARIVG